MPEAPSSATAPAMSPDDWDPLCARTTVVLRAFLAGRADRTRDPVVRDHLASCAACRARYEEAVEAAAHVGGARRRRRDEETLRTERTDELRREDPRAQAAERAASERRARAHRLRLLLLPAAAIVLLTQLGRFGGEVPVETRPIATWIGGEVQAGGRGLDGADDPRLLTRGQRCETGPEGSARLRTGRVTLTLGPETRLLVESAGRFRLERGTLGFEGTCAITTHLGVLEAAEAAGTLVLVDGRLRAAVERAAVTWVDPAGERTLEPGEERLVALRPELQSGS